MNFIAKSHRAKRNIFSQKLFVVVPIGSTLPISTHNIGFLGDCFYKTNRIQPNKIITVGINLSYEYIVI